MKITAELGNLTRERGDVDVHSSSGGQIVVSVLTSLTSSEARPTPDMGISDLLSKTRSLLPDYYETVSTCRIDTLEYRSSASPVLVATGRPEGFTIFFHDRSIKLAMGQ